MPQKRMLSLEQLNLKNDHQKNIRYIMLEITKIAGATIIDDIAPQPCDLRLLEKPTTAVAITAIKERIGIATDAISYISQSLSVIISLSSKM